MAPGAAACTISVSITSSKLAAHGELAPASVVTTLMCAGGRRNRLSKVARSWRMSVTCGGEIAGPEA